MLELTPDEKELILERRKKLQNGVCLKCKKCSHIWIYTGKKKKGFTSCPVCRNSNVNIIKHGVKKC